MAGQIHEDLPVQFDIDCFGSMWEFPVSQPHHTRIWEEKSKRLYASVWCLDRPHWQASQTPLFMCLFVCGCSCLQLFAKRIVSRDAFVFLNQTENGLLFGWVYGKKEIQLVYRLIYTLMRCVLAKFSECFNFAYFSVVLVFSDIK